MKASELVEVLKDAGDREVLVNLHWSNDDYRINGGKDDIVIADHDVIIPI